MDRSRLEVLAAGLGSLLVLGVHLASAADRDDAEVLLARAGQWPTTQRTQGRHGDADAGRSEGPGAATAAGDEGRTVFRCHYDVMLSIDGERFAVRHRDSVRSGSFIPLRFQSAALHLGVVGSGDDSVLVQVSVLEPTAAGKLRNKITYPEISVALGTPTQVSWKEQGVELDLVIAISALAPQR